MSGTAHTGAKEAAWRQELSKANQQVLESQQKILRLKAKTQAQVTKVKVTADQNESTHRQQEEALRQVSSRVGAGQVEQYAECQLHSV